MRHWHNYMVSKCNFWWFFSPESRPLWTKYTTPHIVTLFSGQKRDLPFSESRTKYAFIVDSAIRPPPFWQKILWTTLLKRTYVANITYFTYFKLLLFLLTLPSREKIVGWKGFIYSEKFRLISCRILNYRPTLIFFL